MFSVHLNTGISSGRCAHLYLHTMTAQPDNACVCNQIKWNNHGSDWPSLTTILNCNTFAASLSIISCLVVCILWQRYGEVNRWIAMCPPAPGPSSKRPYLWQPTAAGLSNLNQPSARYEFSPKRDQINVRSYKIHNVHALCHLNCFPTKLDTVVTHETAAIV